MKRQTHAWFARNAGGNDNEVRACEGLGEATVGWEVALDDRGRVDVGEIGSDTWGVDYIKEGELCDGGVRLEEEREGLANATSSTEDDSFQGHCDGWRRCVVIAALGWALIDSSASESGSDAARSELTDTARRPPSPLIALDSPGLCRTPDS
jgi:hypothetical protein